MSEYRDVPGLKEHDEGFYESRREREKPTCRCGRPATIITKPSMLLCDKCARKIFPRLARS